MFLVGYSDRWSKRTKASGADVQKAARRCIETRGNHPRSINHPCSSGGRATDVELHQHSTSLTTVTRHVKNRKVDVFQSTIVKGDKSKMALPVVA